LNKAENEQLFFSVLVYFSPLFTMISLVSSFAASLFLGAYAAIDYSDGEFFSPFNPRSP
jgi:positive regulator of sigma E activity